MVDILVTQGSTVTKGQVVVQVEAMKAKHDIKAPVAGVVSAVKVAIGDEVDSSKPLMLIS